MIIAYDLETTRIEAGTPRLLYLTAYSEDGPYTTENPFLISKSLKGSADIQTYCNILETNFLIPEHNKAMFVAWNGNHFDAYFTAAALLKSDRWLIYPYMTASKSLRGLRIKSKDKVRVNRKYRVLQFQFLDGMSMTGLQGKSLKSFLKTFAPDLPKLTIGDFDNDNFQFNPTDKDHIAYAERDSIGLFSGVRRVHTILKSLMGDDTKFKPTIGSLAINYFMSNKCADVELKRPYGELKDILHGPVKRGGYCWCQKQYKGPVWKYDINQAYAAAMRDAVLPAGDYTQIIGYKSDKPGVYKVTLSRKRPSKIPFYYKIESNPIGRFTTGNLVETWLTSLEIEHLLRDDWLVDVQHGFYWTESFNFAPIVSDLERLRSTDPEGPHGPLGTMVKAIGNHAYGKTLEKDHNNELLIANECPPGWDIYEPFDIEGVKIFSRMRESLSKDYQLPQIGVFVTAHVRCKIRDVALLAPKHFLFADTDCAAFSKPVDLPIHPTRYGEFKIESEGELYIVVGKKTYYHDGEAKAKGLRTKNLTKDDFESWLDDKLPEQTQNQRQNFLKFVSGNDMFKAQKRKGTDVKKSKVYEIKKGQFRPL